MKVIINAYKVPFRRDDNIILTTPVSSTDTICEPETYLTALARKYPKYTFPVGDALQTQFMNNNPSMTIGFKSTGYEALTYGGYNYLQIKYFADQEEEESMGVFYYFIDTIDRLDRKGDVAVIRATMDTLNTFMWAVEWNAGTHIVRQHKNRFKLIYDSADPDSVLGAQVLVDEVAEELPQIPMMVGQTRLVEDSVGGTAGNWRVGYWTDLDSDNKPTGIPEIRLIPEKASKVTATTQDNFTEILLNQNSLTYGRYLYFIRATSGFASVRYGESTISGDLIYITIFRGVGYTALSMCSFFVGAGGQMALSSGKVTETNQSATWIPRIYVNNGETIQWVFTTNLNTSDEWFNDQYRLADKSGGFSSFEDSWVDTSVTPPVIRRWTYASLITHTNSRYGAFSNISTSAVAGSGYDIPLLRPVDKTDPKWIKVVESPYTPSDDLSFDGQFYVAGNSISTDTDHNLLVGIDTPLKNEGFSVSEIAGMTFALNALSDVDYIENAIGAVIGAKRGDINPLKIIQTSFGMTSILVDPKVFASGTMKLEYRYDNATIDLAFERFRWGADSRRESVLDPYPCIVMSFVLSNCFSSNMVFTFDPRNIALEGEQYEMAEPYSLVLTSTRNNDIPLYNSDYLNYMRYGYQFDKQSHDISMIASVLGVVSSVILSGVGIATEQPALVGMGVSGIVSSAIALGAKDAQYRTEMAKRLSELTNTSLDVSSENDVGIFKAYNKGNKLRETIYIPMPYATKLIDEYYFRFGYACDVYGKPNIYTRQRFNYLRCDAKFLIDSDAYDPKIATDSVKTDISDRLSMGVFFVHRSDQEGLDYDPESPQPEPDPDFEFQRWNVTLERNGGNVEMDIINQL